MTDPSDYVATVDSLPLIAEALRPFAVPIAELKHHPDNPKIGDVDQIAESLTRFGQVRPIMTQESSGFIVAGNHTTKAARQLGWSHVAAAPVDLSDDEALAYLLADNRLAELGRYDNEVLAELTARAAGLPGGLVGTGYDEDDVIDGFANVVQTERVAIADLRPHPQNYKQHPPEQLAHLERSLEDNGFYRDVVVANDLTILAGHGVIEAARGRGQRKVPIKRMPYGPDDPRAITIVTGDNELGKLAARDDRQLTESLRELVEQGHDLQGTGFDAQQLANLVYVTRPESEVEGVNAAAEWVGMPDFDPQPDRIQLVLAFDTEEQRDELIAKLELIIAKKTRKTWSAWWPPREMEDLSSLRFERDTDATPEPVCPMCAHNRQDYCDTDEGADTPDCPECGTASPPSWRAADGRTFQNHEYDAAVAAVLPPEVSGDAPAADGEGSPENAAEAPEPGETPDVVGALGEEHGKDPSADATMGAPVGVAEPGLRAAAIDAGHPVDPEEQATAPMNTTAQVERIGKVLADPPADEVERAGLLASTTDGAAGDTGVAPMPPAALSEDLAAPVEPPKINYVRVVDKPASNERLYTHYGCDTQSGRKTWMEPRDDAPLPAIGERVECAECAQLAPIKSAVTEPVTAPVPAQDDLAAEAAATDSAWVPKAAATSPYDSENA